MFMYINVIYTFVQCYGINLVIIDHILVTVAMPCTYDIAPEFLQIFLRVHMMIVNI